MWGLFVLSNVVVGRTSICKFCCLVARYFWRSVASPWSRRHSRRTWTWSPKTHHNALLRERWFQERVLGDQGPTYTRLEALGQRISEKRGFSRGHPSSAQGAIYRRKNGAVERKNLHNGVSFRPLPLPQHWTKRYRGAPSTLRYVGVSIS